VRFAFGFRNTPTPPKHFTQAQEVCPLVFCFILGEHQKLTCGISLSTTSKALPGCPALPQADTSMEKVQEVGAAPAARMAL
jgi:hypothetical protein